MKVAWNLKGGGITGFTMAEDELPTLHEICLPLLIHQHWEDLLTGRA